MPRNHNLLIVDDDKSILASLERLLRKEPYTVFSACSGADGIDILKKHDIAVVVADLNMPGMDGLSFLKAIADDHPAVVKIILTGQATLESAMDAINRLRLFGYLTKPWPVEDIRLMLKRAFEHFNLVEENRRFQELIQTKNRELMLINERLEDKVRKRTAMIEDALREGIMMLATAAEEKDKDTGDHLLRIRQLSLTIGHALNLPREQVETISLFSVIHDVGKIHIPDRILNKPGPLDENEWVIMRAHTTAGEKILGRKAYYAVARQIARSHHENWDGTGYPDGLGGEAIPLAARIVSVADVFDALTSKRPYKEAWTDEQAIAEMIRLKGRKFDPAILDAFLECHAGKGDIRGENAGKNS